MESTLLLSKIIGPVLILRSISILIDREHFKEMVRGLDKEISTISFSLFPVALVMTATALAVLHTDRSTPAGILITLIAYGGILKGSLIILFPKVLLPKAQLLVQAGFLNVVMAVCGIIGVYFCWVGYF